MYFEWPFYTGVTVEASQTKYLTSMDFLLDQWNVPLSLIQFCQDGPLYIFRGHRF